MLWEAPKSEEKRVYSFTRSISPFRTTHVLTLGQRKTSSLGKGRTRIDNPEAAREKEKGKRVSNLLGGEDLSFTLQGTGVGPLDVSTKGRRKEINYLHSPHIKFKNLSALRGGKLSTEKNYL